MRVGIKYCNPRLQELCQPLYNYETICIDACEFGMTVVRYLLSGVNATFIIEPMTVINLISFCFIIEMSFSSSAAN